MFWSPNIYAPFHTSLISSGELPVPSECSPSGRVNPGAWRPHDTSTHRSVQPPRARPKLSLGDSPSSEAVSQGQKEEDQQRNPGDSVSSLVFQTCRALYEPSTPPSQKSLC